MGKWFVKLTLSNCKWEYENLSNYEPNPSNSKPIKLQTRWTNELVEQRTGQITNSLNSNLTLPEPQLKGGLGKLG